MYDFWIKNPAHGCRGARKIAIVHGVKTHAAPPGQHLGIARQRLSLGLAVHRKRVQFGKGKQQPGQGRKPGIQRQMHLPALCQREQKAFGLYQITKTRCLYDQKCRHALPVPMQIIVTAIHCQLRTI